MMSSPEMLAVQREKLGELIAMATDDQLFAEIAKREGWRDPATEHEVLLERLELDELVEGMARKTDGLVVLAIMRTPTIQIANAPPPSRYRAWCKRVPLPGAIKMAESFAAGCRGELAALHLRVPKDKPT